MNIRKIVRVVLMEIETVYKKLKKLKSEEPIIVYRGINEGGKNFYKGDIPLPYTYYSLNKSKAEKYGDVSQYLFQGSVFFGSIFDKFGINASIEDNNVINSLISNGFQAAVVKKDELVVFDKSTIKSF